jgi:TolB protein
VTRAAGEDSFPAWSPDGRAILFNRGTGDLYLIRPDGTGRTRLTRHPRNEAFPSWSPDGSKVAFASDRGRRERSYQIYVMQSDGSAVRRITADRGSHFNPAWQPVPASQ